MENCFDLIKPAVEETTKKGISFQLIGGIGSAALRSSLTEYDSLSNTITSPGLYLPIKRDNGSIRDVDVLVLSEEEKLVKEVEDLFNQTINYDKKELEINVFGLKSYSEIEKMEASPVVSVFKSIVSDRYVVGQNVDKNGYYKAVFPFGVWVPSDTLQTWYVDDKKGCFIPVPHPSRMVLDNLTRSTAGLRKKYDGIIPNIVDNILNKDPELFNWMMDGPGSSMIRLAGVLRALGWKKLRKEVKPIMLSYEKNISIIPPKHEELINDPSFLLRTSDEPVVKTAVYFLSRLKSAGGIGPAERHFQDLWEKFNLERFMKKIVRNNL